MTEVLQDYRQSIKELTFNSRPIIDTLTAVAQENRDVADGIIDIITDRIYHVSPNQKLFALYLLDSICRNVGNPYNILVSGELFKLFSHVYLMVADNIRVKLNSLFEYWKTAVTKGTNLPLFPKSEMDKIQQFLSKANGSSGDITNMKLIGFIDDLIPIFKKRIASNPNDKKLMDKFKALNQLRDLLQNEKSLSIQDLKAVEAQLNSIKQQELGSPMINNSRLNTPTPTPESNTPRQPPMSLPAIPRQGTPTLKKSPITSTNTTPSLSSIVLANATPPPPTMSKANEIFDQLVLNGIITFEQDFNGPRVYDINFPKVVDGQQNNNNLMEAMLNNQIIRNEYDQLKFDKLSKLKVKLHQDNNESQKFINTNNLSIQSKKLLYDSKSLKCSNCGKRFNRDEGEKKRLHLDWHFRINKKFKSNQNVQSRNWYLDDVEWVKFKDENLLEFQVNTNTAPILQSSETNETIPYVIIPSNETNMNNKCLICREVVKGTFNDDLGEWCWEGCIIPPGETNPRKIVHVSCFNETKKRSNNEDINPSVKREKLV